MPDPIKTVRDDARRLVRYVKSAPEIDAERKLAAALLAQRAQAFQQAENMLLDAYMMVEGGMERAETDAERQRAKDEIELLRGLRVCTQNGFASQELF